MSDRYDDAATIERLTAEVARLEHDLLALNFEEVVWLRAEVVRLKAEAVADGVLIADLQTGLAHYVVDHP